MVTFAGGLVWVPVHQKGLFGYTTDFEMGSAKKFLYPTG